MNKHEGHNNKTVKEILQCPCDTYGHVTAQDIQHNEDRMKAAWNQEEPIGSMFFQIEEGVEHAKHGDSPLTKT